MVQAQLLTVIFARLVHRRDVFYVSLGGWDTHNEVVLALQRNYHLVDRALAAFVDEMRAQGVWGQVTVQSASEFGRTLASNGRGTDHGWGGNAFVLGGSINGSRIHGAYPSSLRPDGEQARLSYHLEWHGLASSHKLNAAGVPRQFRSRYPNHLVGGCVEAACRVAWRLCGVDA